MRVFTDVFSSHAGLLSLVVMATMLGMAGYFIRYFLRHIREDEERSGGSR